MKVRIKKLNDKAVIPSYAKAGDAGMDLTATEVNADDLDGVITYKFGLSVEIPEGYVGLLFPRSSVYKTGMTMSNCVGVIDSGYRGELQTKFYSDCGSAPYKVGDRAAQMIIMPYHHIEFTEVDELSTTERGKGGYGSTGK